MRREGASWLAVPNEEANVFAGIATFEGGNVDELRRMGEERMAAGDEVVMDESV